MRPVAAVRAVLSGALFGIKDFAVLRGEFFAGNAGTAADAAFALVAEAAGFGFVVFEIGVIELKIRLEPSLWTGVQSLELL